MLQTLQRLSPTILFMMTSPNPDIFISTDEADQYSWRKFVIFGYVEKKY